jgi:hypothetical protein
VLLQQQPVGRQPNIANAGHLHQHLDQARQLASQQRLAAGQTQLVHAQWRRLQRTNRVISSNVSNSARSRKTTSSGMQ